MDRLSKFYLKYLGANEKALAAGESIFSSDLRGRPESEMTRNVHDLIVSEFRGMLIHSVNQDMLEDYRKLAPENPSDDLLEKVDDAFFQVCGYEYYWISDYFRYSLDSFFEENTDVTVLTADDRKMIENRRKVERGRLFLGNIWEKVWLPLLSEGRYMAVIRDGRIVSCSTVTDLPYNASNIAVWTHEDHRNRGYGSNCVKKAVNWCLQNRRIPIYLVSSTNTASIGLAEKLGFERFAREIRTSVRECH